MAVACGLCCGSGHGDAGHDWPRERAFDGDVSGDHGLVEVYDVFAYERDASPWHQAQMIFHEIGHRLLGHVGETELPLDTRDLVAHLMPTLDPELIRRTLGCAREPSSYDDPRENEAEYIGARLLDRAFGWRAGPLAPDAPAGLMRLHIALGSTRRGGTDGE
jgi:hypothetical protein